MSDAEKTFTTIKFSPDCEIEEISRVALAAVLRIHKIDPALISKLAVSLQQEIKKISAEVRTNGKSRTISASW